MSHYTPEVLLGVNGFTMLISLLVHSCDRAREDVDRLL